MYRRGELDLECHLHALVGTRRRKLWTMGSISRYCLTHSPIPIVVVRPEKRSGEHNCTIHPLLPTPPPNTGRTGPKRTTRRARTVEPPKRPVTQQSEDEGEYPTAKVPQTRRRAGSTAPTSTTTRRRPDRTAAAATSESSEAELSERKTSAIRAARAGDSDEPSASQEADYNSGCCAFNTGKCAGAIIMTELKLECVDGFKCPSCSWGSYGAEH